MPKFSSTPETPVHATTLANIGKKNKWLGKSWQILANLGNGSALCKNLHVTNKHWFLETNAPYQIVRSHPTTLYRDASRSKRKILLNSIWNNYKLISPPLSCFITSRSHADSKPFSTILATTNYFFRRPPTLIYQLIFHNAHPNSQSLRSHPTTLHGDASRQHKSTTKRMEGG